MLKLSNSYIYAIILNSIVFYVILFFALGVWPSADFGPGSDNFGTDENGSASVAYGGYQAEANGYASSDADGNGGEDPGFGQMGIDGGFSAGPGGVGGGLYGGGDGGGEVYGGSGANNVYGDSGNDTLGSNGPEGGTYGPSVVDQMISNSISKAVNKKDLYGPTKDSIARNVETELRDEIDRVNSLSSPSTSDLHGIADMIDAEVQEQVDNLSFLSGGVTTNTINLWEYRVDDRSAVVLKYLLNKLHSADIIGPLAMLGLKGVSMVLMVDLPNSFYARDLDTIYIARRDIFEYGAVVVYHELLHAGLEKARISGAINQSQYDFLSDLGKNELSHLDGYAGTSMGLYRHNGYGYQEAFAVGWSFYKLEKHYRKLPIHMQDKSQNYLIDILNNIVVARTPDGKDIRMVSSNLGSRAGVKYRFINKFKAHRSGIRTRILKIQKRVRSQLPSLCTPGERRHFDKQPCGSNRERAYSYQVQSCKSNYRFETLSTVTCGAWVRDGSSSYTPVIPPNLYSPMPNLCTPGEQRVVDKKICDRNWSNSHSYRLQRCNNNFKFQTVKVQDCGNWVR